MFECTSAPNQCGSTMAEQTLESTRFLQRGAGMGGFSGLQALKSIELPPFPACNTHTHGTSKAWCAGLTRPPIPEKQTHMAPPTHTHSANHVLTHG